MRVLLSIIFYLVYINSSYASPYFVVDTDHVISKSIAYVAFKKSWDAVNQQYQKEIESYEKKIEILDKKLSMSLNSIDEKTLKESRNLIGGYENKIRKLMQQRTLVLDKAMSDALGVLRENISVIIQEYAALHKVNLILSSSQVIYHSNSLDITQKILSALNLRLSKVDITISSDNEE